MKISQLFSLLFILSLSLSAKVSATVITLDAFNQCSAANATLNDGITTADVSGSTSCYGVFSGNLNSNDQISLNGSLFSELTKIDGAQSAVGTDIGFSITNPNTSSGMWSFDANALEGTFMVLLKASNRFAVWVFEGAADDIYSGSWEISYKNNGGKIPALSHISIYGTEGEPKTEVAEPSSIAVFFMSLVAMAFSVRRKLRA